MSEGRFSVLKSVRKSDRASLITDVDNPDVDLTSATASAPSNHYGSVSSADGGKQPNRSGRNFFIVTNTLAYSSGEPILALGLKICN
jgi:hypothetical protein